jgi:hypothetical protein
MSFPGGMSLFELSTANTGSGSEPGTSVASAGSKLILAPNISIAIMRWGFICTTTVNDATNPLVMTLDWHPTVGSTSGAVVGATTVTSAASQWNASTQGAFATDLAGGSITLTKGTSQIAAGKGVFHLIQPQTKMPPNDASTNPVPSPDTALVPGGGMQSLGFTVYPGQEVQVSVSAVAPGAGAGIIFIHYFHLSFEGQGTAYAAINSSTLATGIPSSITPVVGDPGMWVRAIS